MEYGFPRPEFCLFSFACWFCVFGFLVFVCFAVGAVPDSRLPIPGSQFAVLSFPTDPLTAVNVTCKCAFPLPVAVFHNPYKPPPSIHTLTHPLIHMAFRWFVEKPTVWQEVAQGNFTACLQFTWAITGHKVCIIRAERQLWSFEMWFKGNGYKIRNLWIYFLKLLIRGKEFKEHFLPIFFFKLCNTFDLSAYWKNYKGLLVVLWNL